MFALTSSEVALMYFSQGGISLFLLLDTVHFSLVNRTLNRDNRCTEEIRKISKFGNDWYMQYK